MRVWAQVVEQAGGAPISVAHVCAAAVAGLGVDGAAVTLVAGPTIRETVHATDQVAGELEEWQLAFGQGPCVDAFTTGGPVLVVDLDSPDELARWSAFAPAALGSGARAMFALPMLIGAVRLGVLDLYRARPGSLAPPDLADALACTEIAGAMLLDGMAGLNTADPPAHQAQVHQATGMLLAQLGISADAAFARLRAYAYAHDRRLGDVARDVVERTLRFERDPPPAGHDGG